MTDTVSRLVVELDLNDRDFRANIRGSTRDLKRFKDMITSSRAPMRQHERTVRSLGASFRHMVVTLGLLREALRTAWQATGGLVAGVIKVNAEFERLGILLQGMSKGTTEIERARDAQDQFNQVMDMAKTAPFTVRELTNSWVKFKSVGLDPADGSMRSLVDAVARFGGTDDILHRATIAVQQMAGKGVISMEELRQQMGEAVPQALVLLARGMNMSVQEMVDSISRGEVEATSALRKLFAEFDLTFGGASQRLMETFVGSVARLKTVWQLTLNEIGKSSGLFETTKGYLQDLIERLQDPAIRRFGIDIAAAVRDGIVFMVESGKTLIENWEKIKKALKVLIATFAAYRLALIATSKETKALIAVTSAFRVYMSNIPYLVGQIATAIGGWTMGKIALANATKTVIAALRLLKLTNPVGWITMIVGALVFWKTEQEEVNEVVESGIEKLERYGLAADKLSVDQARAEVAVLSGQVATLIQVKNQVIASMNMDEDMNEAQRASARRNLAEIDAQIVTLNREVERREALIDRVAVGQFVEEAQRRRRQIEADFDQMMSEFLNQARAADQEIEDRFRDPENEDFTAEDRLAARQENWQNYLLQVRTEFLNQLKPLQQEIVDANTMLASSSVQMDPDQVRVWEQQRDVAIEGIKDLSSVFIDEWTRVNRQMGEIARENVKMVGDEEDMAKRAAALQTFYQSAQAKLAGIQAQLGEGNTETEKFLALWESDRFGGGEIEWPSDINEAMQMVLDVVRELDEAGEELKNKKAFESAMANIAGQLAQVTEEAEMFQEAIDDEAQDAAANRTRKFRRMLAQLAAQLELSGEALEAFNAVADQLLAKVQDVEVNREILDVQGQLRELELEGITNARDRNALEIQQLEIQMELFLLRNAEAENIEELRLLYEQLIQKKKEAFENNTPIRRMLKDWEDAMGNMEQAGAQWIDGFVNTLVDGMETGKFAFKDFAKTVLKEILRIIIRAQIARIILASIGAIGGASGSSATLPGNTDSFGLAFAKMGGIIGPKGHMPLKRYAQGGIATRPQVAIFGEGDQNEAYVPLPDGRSIPVSVSGGGTPQANVEVNVINESGTEVEAEQEGTATFDGEKYVLDVVLRAANRPGGFRDGMKGAMR